MNTRSIGLRRQGLLAALGAIPLSIAVGCGETHHDNGNVMVSNGGEREVAGAAAGEPAGGEGGSNAGAGGTMTHAGTGGLMLTLAGAPPTHPMPPTDGGQPDQEACGILDEGLVVATNAVPNAELGTAYDFSLVPLGGTLKGYSFSVASGALPPGIVLDADGKLHGTATAEGTTQFTVKLTDSVKHESQQQLSLVVTRHRRWRGIELPRGLVLVDQQSPNAPLVELGETDESHAVSPDGTHAAYVEWLAGAGGSAGAGPGEDTATQALYVVDLTVDGPLVPQQIATKDDGLFQFAWSPDSHHLSYASDMIHVADLSGPKATIVDVKPSAPAYQKWVTPTTLIFYAASTKSYQYSTLRNGAFSAPKELPSYEPLLAQQAAGHQMVYGTRDQTRLIDFDSGKVTTLRGEASTGLSFLADDAPGGRAWEVSTLADRDTKLVSAPELWGPSFVWGGDSSLMAINNRIGVVHLSGANQHRVSLCVDGLRPEEPALTLGGFSPDGTWLVFDHRVGDKMALSLVGIKAGELQPPIDIASDIGEGLGAAFDFSSDSRWVTVWSASNQNAADGLPLPQLSLVRLDAEAPLAPKPIKFTDGITFPRDATWSDATHLDVLGDTSGLLHLYEVDTTDPDLTPKLIELGAN